MTYLGAPEFWRFWLEEASKRPRKGQERPGRGQEEARKRPGTGQKRPGRVRMFEKRHQKARNPEFGEKLLETPYFMNRK